MELSTEDKLILSCIKIHPSAVELEQINNLIPLVQDWYYLISTIIDRGIGPLLYQKLPLLSNSALIPIDVKTNLQQVYYKTFSRSTILYNHFSIIAKSFTEHNIPVIALKGIYLSEWLYKDIGLRQFSDIDLLIRKVDAEECLSLLTELGYIHEEDIRSEYVARKHEVVHYTPRILNGVSVELHIKLARTSERYNLPVDVLWNDVIPATINNSKVLVLDINHLLIHLCGHLDKHFHEGHVQFTCFNDITNLLDKELVNIDWNDLTETCRKYNCEDIVFKYLVLVYKYMNASLPENVFQKHKSLLTLKEEQLFIKYLNGYSTYASGVPAHFGSMKNLNSFQEKIRFVWEILLPSKEFMIKKYGLVDSSKFRVMSIEKKEVLNSESGVKILENEVRVRNSKLETQNYKLMFWWLWYPYRWWVGLKGVWKLIVKS